MKHFAYIKDGQVISGSANSLPEGVEEKTLEEVKAFCNENKIPLTYKQLRKSEYPEIGDQLDEIMKWLSTETEFGIPDKLKSMAMTCMSVKSKYPKE